MVAEYISSGLLARFVSTAKELRKKTKKPNPLLKNMLSSLERRSGKASLIIPTSLLEPDLK